MFRIGTEYVVKIAPKICCQWHIVKFHWHICMYFIDFGVSTFGPCSRAAGRKVAVSSYMITKQGIASDMIFALWPSEREKGADVPIASRERVYNQTSTIHSIKKAVPVYNPFLVMPFIVSVAYLSP